MEGIGIGQEVSYRVGRPVPLSSSIIKQLRISACGAIVSFWSPAKYLCANLRVPLPLVDIRAASIENAFARHQKPEINTPTRSPSCMLEFAIHRCKLCIRRAHHVAESRMRGAVSNNNVALKNRRSQVKLRGSSFDREAR